MTPTDRTATAFPPGRSLIEVKTKPSASVQRRLWTTGAVTLSVFCTAMAGYLASQSDVAEARVTAGLVVNLIAAAALVRRHDKPWWVFAVTLVAPILFVSDATAALIALYTVLKHFRDRRAYAAIVPALVACGISFMYDAARPREFSVLTIGAKRDEAGQAVEQWNLSPVIPWLAAVVLVGAVTGLALLRRTRSALIAAVEQGDVLTVRSRQLHEEMLLAEERARIARDMHDTLAGSLSQISLLAGGLQVTSADGPEKTANTASLIRNAAHESLSELKQIIGVLRGPSGDSNTAGSGGSGLDGIPDLVSVARNGGMHIVFHTDIHPGQLGPLAGAVAFRVVQEGISNARKHASGMTTHVALQAEPSSGVRIWVRNPLGAPSPASPLGSGTGLQGMAERVRGIGGTVFIGPHNGEFVLNVWLPWHS